MINYAKIKDGVLSGPQIRELIWDVKFEDRLSEVGKNSMEIIQKCHDQFLGGNHKAEKYLYKVADLVQSYKAVGC